MPSGAIIITERDTNGTEYEIIPPTLLEDEMPYLLCTNYSHWWNKRTNIIDFRPKDFSHHHFKTDIAYQLNLKEAVLIHVKSGRPMLDVTSPSYQSIAQIVQRLECNKYVHIYVEQEDGRPSAKIELTRMKLKFQVVANGSGSDTYDVVSNEFSGMVVAAQQNGGSLYGLWSGLMLESKGGDQQPKERVLLVPHSDVIVHRTDDHVNVSVDVATLRDPPFHRYQLDESAWQMRSANSCYSAWLYLAYLHAVTSHGEIEPLLGMSGTERALQILQSGKAPVSLVHDSLDSPFIANATDPLRSAQALCGRRPRTTTNPSASLSICSTCRRFARSSQSESRSRCNGRRRCVRLPPRTPSTSS